MTKRQYLVAAIASLLIILVSVGLHTFFAGMKEEVKQKRPPVMLRKVQSSIVEYQDSKAKITSNGRVVSQQSIDVISEVQGKILPGEISLRKGSTFRKGDILVRIYRSDAEYALNAKKSSFLNSLAGVLPDLRIDYPNSYTSWVDFFESVKITEDLPKIPNTESSQEKIFLSSKGILRDYYSIRSDEVRLKKYTIYAPFDGSVQQVNLEPGSVANPGSRIASIIRTNQLEIEVPLEIDEAEWVNIGHKAKIFNDSGKEIGLGQLVRKSAFVDPNNQSINVYVKVLPGSSQVYSGQYMKVQFDGMVLQHAMEIPRNAVFNNNIVYVVDSGYLVKREVEILKVDQQTLFFRGLEEGTEIVTQPLTGVNASMAVQTEFSKPPRTKNDSTQATSQIAN